MQLSLPGLPKATSRFLPVLDQRQRGTEFLELPVRSVLNSPATTHMGFWSLNPYVGCEFGCSYCYARDTHRWTMDRADGNRTDRADRTDRAAKAVGAVGAVGAVDPLDDFEKRILVKAGAAEVLARTLEPGKLGSHSLVIGTATDPYQPAERKFRVTRRILEMLLHYRGLSIGIITKSALVARDAALLRELTERHDVSVNISVATLDAKLARRLEPRSPVPRARLRALRTLTSAGVHAGLLIAPILPGITDDTPGLTALMAAGRDHGARYAVGSPLRLSDTIRQRFLPMLRREFPDLVEKYERHYRSRDYVSRSYHQALKQRLARLERKLGFPVERTGERMGNRQ